MRDLVIALHCSGSSSRQWRALAEQLEPHGRFVAVDLHGHGVQPPWPAERALTLADEATLVAPLLTPALARSLLNGRPGGDEAPPARLHLIGHSYGGAVALKVASQYPRHVHSVAVFEPVLFRLLRDDPASAAEGAQVRQLVDTMHHHHTHGNTARAAECFVDYWSGRGTFARSSEARRAAAAAHVSAILTHFDALFDEPVLSRALPKLSMPVLVMSGGTSTASAKRIAALLRARMPAARHETLPGVGHLAPVSHAEPVNVRWMAFLQAAGLGVASKPAATKASASPAAAGPIRVPLAGMAGASPGGVSRRSSLDHRIDHPVDPSLNLHQEALA